MIELLVNHENCTLDGVAANLSVLDWLRDHRHSTGTKEGCASGDCGACTVVIGEVEQGVVKYASYNACLLLVGNLHGKHLITVDSLASAKNLTVENLHPVQRAMVECHGSQCGFCTPGFIMSMYVLYLNHEAVPNEHTIIEALGGNLCRCTGYRPIIDACKKMYEYPREEFTFAAAASEFFKKPAIANPKLSYRNNVFLLPQNLTSLLALKEEFPLAKLVAGGTDLSLEFTQMLKSYSTIISVAQVDELQRLSNDGKTIRIGAALPYSKFVELLCEDYPESLEMFNRLGSQQVRNAGTLGGSLGNASPIGDPAPLLLALNAQVICTSEQSERSIPLAEFFTGYRQTVLNSNEIITAVEIPTRPENFKLVCYKVSKRMEDDISAVLFAMGFQLVDGKIENVSTGFGGMAAVPAKAKKLEQTMQGEIFSLEVLQKAGEELELDFNPMTDVRATSDYRINVCKNLLERLWHEQNSQNTVRVSHAAL